MTPEQIAEGRRLLDAATPGPWNLDTDRHGHDEVSHRRMVGMSEVVAQVGRVRPDAELIVWARNNLPALLAALDDAECESERLRGDWIIENRQRKAVEAALAQARATNARLNRRCQQAEKAARENIDACQRAGMSFGRSLANYGAMLYLEDLERAQASIDRLRALTLRPDGSSRPDEFRISVRRIRAALGGVQ